MSFNKKWAFQNKGCWKAKVFVSYAFEPKPRFLPSSNLKSSVGRNAGNAPPTFTTSFDPGTWHCNTLKADFWELPKPVLKYTITLTDTYWIIQGTQLRGMQNYEGSLKPQSKICHWSWTNRSLTQQSGDVTALQCHWWCHCTLTRGNLYWLWSLNLTRGWSKCEC